MHHAIPFRQQPFDGAGWMHFLMSFLPGSTWLRSNALKSQQKMGYALLHVLPTWGSTGFSTSLGPCLGCDVAPFCPFTQPLITVTITKRKPWQRVKQSISKSTQFKAETWRTSMYSLFFSWMYSKGEIISDSLVFEWGLHRYSPQHMLAIAFIL